MLQNPCKTLGFKKNMVYEIPPGGGGKPYPASGLYINPVKLSTVVSTNNDSDVGFCLQLLRRVNRINTQVIY